MTPSICLVMIVRDEAETLPRCLDSVREHIDSYVIHDTGSTDATKDVIADELYHTPGIVREVGWMGFGPNRTGLVNDLGGFFGAEYLLCLDADMTLEALAPLPRLWADAYMLGYTGALDYRQPLLIAADVHWRYEGLTHEYLSTTGRSVEDLDAWAVTHHGDGGSRADKVDRDVRLLSKAVANDLDDERSVFYLAESLRLAGKTDEAIRWYRKRAAMGGFDEERFYAQLQLGRLLPWPDAIPALLEAWEMRPSRFEPFYELAKGFRQREQYQQARLFAEEAWRLGYPHGDYLFIDRAAYEWGIYFELSIALWYCPGGREASAVFSDQVIAAANVPDDVREQALANRALCDQ